MSDRRPFDDAVSALHRATSPTSDLCGPVVSALGVDLVAVASLGAPLGTGIVCASDDAAARLLELELVLGEGPGWQSAARGSPVSEPHLDASAERGWPLTRQAYRDAGLGAVFAFPLRVAGTGLGVMTVYSAAPTRFPAQRMHDAEQLSRIVARQMLYRAPLPGEAARADVDPYASRELHQATGMVIAQTGVGVEGARGILRDHAARTGRPLREVAADVVARRISFTPRA